MKDFIVRLASMKLAELKFEVEFVNSTPREHEGFSDKSTIRDIKKMITSFFYPVDKLDIEASVNEDVRENYWVAEIYQYIAPKDQYLEVIIYKPDNMPLDLFKKIMKSSGLLDVSKLKSLVKNRVKK